MPRRLAVAALSALALVAPAAVAFPPTPLTRYSTSDNVRLLTNVPTGVGVGGKFSGGYYFHTTARSTGYNGPSGDAVSDGGLWVFDVKDPERPTVAAHVPLPLWQNEDVDLSAKRKILLVAMDRRTSTAPAPSPVDAPQLPGMLFVYDIAEPTRPLLRSTVTLPAEVGTGPDGKRLHGAGHTASCVLDCTYAWVSGARDGSVLVVDLRDTASPKVVGTFATPAGNPHKSLALVHDVDVDSYGNVWVSGTGGTAMYAPVSDPMQPRLIASTTPADNARTNQVIHHNTMRLDKHHVLLSEEAFMACGTAGGPASDAPQGGRFQTWRIDRDAQRLVPVAMFSKQIPGVPSCSSHWMDVNGNGVVADAFFDAGVRFFDVRDPKVMRQVGYFRASDGAAGQAQYVPGRPDLVYVSDYLRGLDVVKIDDAGAGAPEVTSEGAEVGLLDDPKITFRPSADWGNACPVPLV